MFGNLDYSNVEVREDVKRWIEWIGKETRIKAVRFDAVKHWSQDFLRDLIHHVDRTGGANWFLVGEVSFLFDNHGGFAASCFDNASKTTY